MVLMMATLEADNRPYVCYVNVTKPTKRPWLRSLALWDSTVINADGNEVPRFILVEKAQKWTKGLDSIN